MGSALVSMINDLNALLKKRACVRLRTREYVCVLYGNKCTNKIFFYIDSLISLHMAFLVTELHGSVGMLLFTIY